MPTAQARGDSNSRRELALQRPVYIYQINDGADVVYVGATVDMHNRAAAHQQSASKCRKVAAFVESKRGTSWKFADNFRLVDG